MTSKEDYEQCKTEAEFKEKLKKRPIGCTKTCYNFPNQGVFTFLWKNITHLK